MNITVTFRHVDASDAIRDHATDKIAKLQKFLRQPMTARVTVSLDKLLHAVEARISSGGERYEAHEATEDMYASIDKVLDKLERQIRAAKGAAQDKKRRGAATVRGASEADLAPPSRARSAKVSGKASKVKKGAVKAR
jgi:putative sigma-54 modulation protein